MKSWASTSIAELNIRGKKPILCIRWDKLGLVYYELLKPNKTYWGSLLYAVDKVGRPSIRKERCAHYDSRHNNIILLRVSVCLHVAASVKTYLETLNWEVLSHPLT